MSLSCPRHPLPLTTCHKHQGPGPPQNDIHPFPPGLPPHSLSPLIGFYPSFPLPLLTSCLCLHLCSPLCLLGPPASVLGYDPVLDSQERLPAPHPSSSLPKGHLPEHTRKAEPSLLPAVGGLEEGTSVEQGPALTPYCVIRFQNGERWPMKE